MKSDTNLGERLASIVSLDDLKNFVRGCLKSVAEEKNPVAGYMLAEAIASFKPTVSGAVFEASGVIPDPDFYRGWAFHRFMELAEKQQGDAARWIAHYYLVGACPVEKSDSEYRKWLKLAAEYGDRLSAADLADAKHDQKKCSKQITSGRRSIRRPPRGQ